MQLCEPVGDIPVQTITSHSGPAKVRGHIIMQNTFGPTSKVPLVFHTPNTVEKPSVSSEPQGNLLTITPIKIKRQITSFQHIMAWNINYLSRKEEWGHREETLDQAGQTPKPRSSTSDVTGLDSSTLPTLLPEAHDSLLGCFHSPWAALLGRCIMALESSAC
jgi:hypothetical protein